MVYFFNNTLTNEICIGLGDLKLHLLIQRNALYLYFC